MSICGKLKSVRRGKNKRLAKCKSLFVITNISLLVILSCVNKYLCVPVFADTEVSYYTPQEVGNITIGDMVISLQNASGFTITDKSYANAIKNNMSGTDQDIEHIMAMSEGDAVQYLNVCINNAESAGATKLSNSLSISSDMADYLNQQYPNSGVVAQNGGEMLYESIKETYKQNTENDDILSRSRAVMQGALKRISSGVAESPRDLANLTITGIAGTMFGIPGATIAALKTGLFSNNVKNGVSILMRSDNIVESGIYYAVAYKNNTNYNYFRSDNIKNPIVGWPNGNYYTIGCFESYYATSYDSNNVWIGQSGGNFYNKDKSYAISGVKFFNSRSEATAYYRSLQDQEIEYNPVSPDVVSNQGNVNLPYPYNKTTHHALRVVDSDHNSKNHP